VEERVLVLVAAERLHDPAGDGAQLLGMLETPRFLLEPRILVGVGETGLVDLLDNVSQVIGAPLGLGAATLQIGDLSPHGNPGRVRDGHLLGEHGRARERVEYVSLRICVEQCLGLVLTVQVHEPPSDLGEQAGADRSAVHPGTRAASGCHLPLEDDE
jgi:hypothetical protein